MTIKEIAKVAQNTPVLWVRDGDPQTAGRVRVRPDLNVHRPHRMIEWEDGQWTDGRDDAALVYVQEARP